MTPKEFHHALRGQQRANGIDPDGEVKKQAVNDDWRLPDDKLRKIMKGEF
jgi:hypothetical protein